MRIRAIPVTLAVGAGLAGCFGGGGDEVVTAPAADPLASVPPATATSVSATIDYLGQLASLNSAAESREPIDLSGVSLATSDTDEPTALN
jgi:hypothetical protein